MTDPPPDESPDHPTRAAPPTAQDRLAELFADPELRARREAMEARQLAFGSQMWADPTALYADLVRFGAPATALDTCFDGVTLTARTMGVLVVQLPRNHAPDIWERVVRSLSRPTARPVLPMLRWAYRIERDARRRWLLANAIGAMARLEEVRDLAGIEAYEPLFRPGLEPPHRRKGP